MKIYVESKCVTTETFLSGYGQRFIEHSITIYGNHELPLKEDRFCMHLTEESFHTETVEFEDPFSYGTTVEEHVSENRFIEKQLIHTIKSDTVSIGSKEDCQFILGKRYEEFCRLSNKIKDDERAIWYNELQKIQDECEKPHYEIMKSYILAGDFNINEPLPNNGNSALGESYIYNDIEYARWLIDEGAWYIEYDAFNSTYEGWHDKYYKGGRPIWEHELVYKNVYTKREVENVGRTVSSNETSLNLLAGHKSYAIVGLFGYQKITTRKKISEWTQNMNVLKFVLSELGVDYYHKLISLLRSHFPSIPCEDEICLMELKYYIYKNDIQQFIFFINSCPKYKEMMILYGLTDWNDNEYAELYYNSSVNFKIYLSDWRQEEREKQKSINQHINVKRNNLPTLVILDPIRNHLSTNNIDALKQDLNKISSNRDGTIHKKIVLAQYYDGLNALVDAYFKSSLETKQFFDEWRTKESKLYLNKATLIPLFYKDSDGNILKQRNNNNEYEVTWHFGSVRT